MRKQATLKPEKQEEKARNRKAAKPKPMATSDCKQKALLSVHVSPPLIVLASAAAADPADSNR
ncbi:unnamed protein product [Brassica rapa]|nr:unnamed protein product [Brassica napus]CAG7905599.1 unnamed protein product [Brassica rapa]VDD10846.1 unnamed protein product [Brassica rapa]